MDRHRQLANPAGQYALDVVLPQPEHVRMPGGKIAEGPGNAGEAAHARHLSFGDEAFSDSALIENLEGARVQPARARAGESLALAPLDDGDVDPGQR